MVNFRKKSRNIKSKKTNSQKTNSQKTIKHGGSTEMAGKGDSNTGVSWGESGWGEGGNYIQSSNLDDERTALETKSKSTSHEPDKDEKIKLKKELIFHIKNDIEKVCEAKRERKTTRS